MNAFLSGIAAEKQKNFLFLENGASCIINNVDVEN